MYVMVKLFMNESFFNFVMILLRKCPMNQLILFYFKIAKHCESMQKICMLIQRLFWLLSLFSKLFRNFFYLLWRFSWNLRFVYWTVDVCPPIAVFSDEFVFKTPEPIWYWILGPTKIKSTNNQRNNLTKQFDLSFKNIDDILKNFKKSSTNVHYYVVLSIFFVEFVLQIVLLLLSASSLRFTSALN